MKNKFNNFIRFLISFKDWVKEVAEGIHSILPSTINREVEAWRKKNKKPGLRIGDLHLIRFRNYEQFSKAVREAFNKKLSEAWLHEEWLRYNFARKQKHPWHIVSPSPWPLLLSWSILIFVIGILAWFYRYETRLFLLGFVLVAISGSFWFRDIIREGVYMGYHTMEVQNNLRIAFSLFIVSEVMFFFSFFWSYLHIALSPGMSLGNTWPPEGICNTFLAVNLNQYKYTEEWTNTSPLRNIYDMPYKELYNAVKPSKFFPKLTDVDLLKNYIYVIDASVWNPKIRHEYITLFNQGIAPYIKTMITIAYRNGDINFTYEDLIKYGKPYAWEPFLDVLNTRKSNERFWNIYNKSAALGRFFIQDYVLWLRLNEDRTAQKLGIIGMKPPLIGILYSEGVLINPLGKPLVNTFILLSSGATITACHKYLKSRKYLFSIIALTYTIILGISFLINQYFEYGYAQFSMTDGVYGSLFYLLTGFHGLHVIMGTIFLIVCLGRFLRQHFTPTVHLGLEFAIWYWHFVDVVWLLLYFIVYYWPNLYYFAPYHFEGYDNYSFIAAINVKEFEPHDYNHHLAKYNWRLTRGIIDKFTKHPAFIDAFNETIEKIKKEADSKFIKPLLNEDYSIFEVKAYKINKGLYQPINAQHKIMCILFNEWKIIALDTMKLVKNLDPNTGKFINSELENKTYNRLIENYKYIKINSEKVIKREEINMEKVIINFCKEAFLTDVKPKLNLPCWPDFKDIESTPIIKPKPVEKNSNFSLSSLCTRFERYFDPNHEHFVPYPTEYHRSRNLARIIRYLNITAIKDPNSIISPEEMKEKIKDLYKKMFIIDDDFIKNLKNVKKDRISIFKNSKFYYEHLLNSIKKN